MKTSPVTLERTIAMESSDVRTEVCELLNNVIAKAINSRNAFKDCGAGAESLTLSKKCMDWSRRRDAFALVLQKTVSRLGHSPALDENFVGWVHRQWTKGRIAVESGTDHAIVEEMNVEEESMRLAIKDALECEHIPIETRKILEEEQRETMLYKEVFETLDDVLEPDDYVNLNKDS